MYLCCQFVLVVGLVHLDPVNYRLPLQKHLFVTKDSFGPQSCVPLHPLVGLISDLSTVQSMRTNL